MDRSSVTAAYRGGAVPDVPDVPRLPASRPAPPLPGRSFDAKLNAMTGPVDPTDLGMWAQGVPYPEFARLRREAPVAWRDEAAPNSGFWSVLCYKDIVAASRDVGTFSSARGTSFGEPTDEDMIAPPHDHRHRPTGAHQAAKDRFPRLLARAVAVYQHFVEPRGSRWRCWRSASCPPGCYGLIRDPGEHMCAV